MKSKTINSTEVLNTIIIGGGPAGLYLANLLEKDNLSYLMIEGFNKVGGQCITAYPYKYMYDVPGLGKITGMEYTSLLLKSINQENILLNTQYLSHSKKEDVWRLETTNGEYHALNLVFATGVGMGSYQKPKIYNLELYENKQIFFFPQQVEKYHGKKVAVFGGGDSAFDAIEMLHSITDSLTLIHRRNTFTAMPHKQQLLKQVNKIQVYTPYTLEQLNGDMSILESVMIKNQDCIINLEVDYLFFCYGYNTIGNIKFKVNMMNMRDESGVFAIGAASDYELKRDLITTSLWESRIVFSHLIR